MTSKTFSVVGITTHNGETKVRFANDLIRRVKQFSKGGATRCDFVELPSEMTKVEALNYMLTLHEFASPGDQATINEALEDRVKAPRVVKAKPSLEAIKARAKNKATTTASDVLDAVAV
jgi:hypothetical protein